ncbi:TrlF family AAA-like ATPase [Mycobacterium sp.]|uniref:TrlF family AAA-like ATPase n=1 Tax=Mycobacterium sp. TaxID=1785 RepID=UPI003F98D765
MSDNGAHFYRCDFQVHTPRDTNWKGTRATTEAERKDYATKFVAACRQKELHAVAITDHHDFCLFPYIKAAAEAELDHDGNPLPPDHRLVVFPGLELTLGIPCQALLILDADFPTDRLTSVLEALSVDPSDNELEALPPVIRLDKIQSFNQLYDEFDSRQWLKGRYIVLPNVTDGGHGTLMRAGMQAKYKTMPCVGGYLDGTVDAKVGDGNLRIFDGLNNHWGNHRLALFQTSDSRSETFEDLGKHSTWVKWSKPTAEAIRQACLAQESRVSQTDPALPNVWVSRVVVSQSKFMGRVDLTLNPQYTALIGGRGTGKSTILDYIRWALCDQPARATEDDEVADPRVRQRKLIEATLKPFNSQVEVHCVINGIPHVVRRNAADGSVQLKVGDAAFENVREAAIQSLLPIQAYSQKQLSSVAIRIDELLRFVTSPIQRQLEDVERRLQEVSGRLRENYGTLQRYRNLSAEIERSQIRIRSLADQAQALRDGLTGLSEEDRKTLDEKAAYDDVRASQAAWVQQVQTVDSELEVLISSLDTSLLQFEIPGGIPDAVAADVNTLRSTARDAVGQVRDSMTGLASGLRDAIGNSGAVQAAQEALIAKLAAYDTVYAAVKERSSTHETKLAELASLEEQQRVARELLQEQRRELATLNQPVERHNELRAELASARAERTQALAAECGALSAASDGLIRARLSAGRGFAAAQSKFKALISGSNVRANKIETFFERLAEESDPVATWETVLRELELLMLMEPDTEIRSEQTPILSRLEIPLADQKRLTPKLTPDGWLDMSLVELTNYPEFEYRAKENEYIPFDAASAGQQASALLTTLLSHSGMPLIIDQPEEDLDSDTVQQIVAKIWQSKSGRQLIFSSHNANLVVNGDADLVLVCAYITAGDQSAGHIKREGAIDMPEVKREITVIMEGGEKAFRLRKEKYGF